MKRKLFFPLLKLDFNILNKLEGSDLTSFVMALEAVMDYLKPHSHLRTHKIAAISNFHRSFQLGDFHTGIQTQSDTLVLSQKICCSKKKIKKW